MKNLTSIGVAVMMIFASPVAMASPVAALPQVATVSAGTQVGVVAAVKGKVELSKSGQVGRLVESGQEVYMGDIIKTDAGSTIQLMLMDETIFTIGPSSEMRINEFSFNPETDSGKITAEVIEGTFKFITGRIPHKKPTNMSVKLPVGVMAVRGTAIGIHAQRPENGPTTAILIGPGGSHQGHNTRIGRFSLENAGQTTLVSMPGHASRIDGAGIPPTPSFTLPKVQLDMFTSTLAGNEASKAPENESPAAAAQGDSTAKEGKGEPKVEGAPVATRDDSQKKGADGPNGPNGPTTGTDAPNKAPGTNAPLPMAKTTAAADRKGQPTTATGFEGLAGEFRHLGPSTAMHAVDFFKAPLLPVAGDEGSHLANSTTGGGGQFFADGPTHKSQLFLSEGQNSGRLTYSYSDYKNVGGADIDLKLVLNVDFGDTSASTIHGDLEVSNIPGFGGDNNFDVSLPTQNAIDSSGYLNFQYSGATKLFDSDCGSGYGCNGNMNINIFNADGIAGADANYSLHLDELNSGGTSVSQFNVNGTAD